MNGKKVKLTLIILVSLLIGGFGGVYATGYFIGKFMMFGLYVGSAADVNIYMSLLKFQSSGEESKLTETIEQQLQVSKIILDGCKSDLCSDHEYEIVNEALKKLDEYKFIHVEPYENASQNTLSDESLHNE